MTTPSRSLPPWFRAFALALLLVQGVLAGTWVMEGVQGIGFGAHVEAQGGTTHHAHDEAECPSCAGRSIHASAPLLPRALHVRRSPHQVRIVQRAMPPATGGVSIHASRAPPRLAVGPML
ncbi:MAG: hypothetical protein ABI910_12285 [Gemmatimonadota bacterium]